MKLKYWIYIGLFIGMLLGYFGKICFLVLITGLWSSGGIIYLSGCVYYQAFEKLRQKKPLPYEQTYHQWELAYYEARMKNCNKWACILMYIGCIAVIEAVIIL